MHKAQRPVAVVGALIMSVLACESPPEHQSTLLEPTVVLSWADTVPCPRNVYNWTVCTQATPEQLQILENEVNRFAPTPLCQQAGTLINEALSNVEEVYVFHHSYPDAEIRFNEAVGPPHQPEALSIAHFALWPEYVAQGDLRAVLYHEAAHLMGYPDGSGSSSAEGFAQSCLADEPDEEDTYTVEVEEAVGGGGECTESCEDERSDTWCMVRYTYYLDTGEIIDREVLYCW